MIRDKAGEVAAMLARGGNPQPLPPSYAGCTCCRHYKGTQYCHGTDCQTCEDCGQDAPPIPLTTMRECVNNNALACLAELRGAALDVLANGSPTPDKLLRLAKACEASAWVDA